MTHDPIGYISDAIQKIEAGHAASTSGSHVAGIFGKAAKAFENEVRSYVATLLRTSGLDYEAVRPAVKGLPFEKLTLGNCVAAITEIARLKPAHAVVILDGWPLPRFIDALKRINNAWVQEKHGREIEQSDLLAQMKTMSTILKALTSGSP